MPIAVKNLTKKYGAQVAVNAISFSIEKGIVGFLGPNGAGKSTTMKMLTGFIPSDSGDIWINGVPMNIRNSKAKAAIGYLPESNPLYSDMYVQEYLDIVARLHKLPRPSLSCKNVIMQVGLHPEAHKKIGALSKGYKQRVGLAAALIHDPSVLILDEPTSGLDPNQIIEIRAVIRSLSDSKTILLSTHIMQEAEALCSRAIIINKGNIMADDSLENLRSLSSGKNYMKVEFAREVDIQNLKSLSFITGVTVLHERYSFRLETTDAAALRKSIMALSIEKDLPLVSLINEEQNLESVFQSLTLSTF